MEEKEIQTYDVEVETEVEAVEESNNSFGIGALIGAGAVLAIGAGVTLAKKGYRYVNAKRAEATAAKEAKKAEAIDVEYEEVSDDEK